MKTMVRYQVLGQHNNKDLLSSMTFENHAIKPWHSFPQISIKPYRKHAFHIFDWKSEEGENSEKKQQTK